MSLEAPPTQQPIILDQSGMTAVQWIIFFNSMFNGDLGDAWVPTFRNLTVVGATPSVTGRIYQLSQALKLFTARIIPGTSTSAVAGTTYIDNFPLTMNGDGINFAVSGNLGTNSGMCDSSTGRIYVPGWSAVTVPLTIFGIVEAT